MKSTPVKHGTVTRRDLLKAGLAAAAATPLLGPRIGFGRQANETLQVASVGVGNMGWADLTQIAGGKHVRIVALCDVDSNNLGKATKQFPQAKTYRDYRRMFDKMGGDIDAVQISTPDHMHGPVALAAMSLGKHVYVQKPLAHNLAELRAMADMAAEKKLVTQMGTQIHSHEAYRTAVAMVRAGAIGRVSEVHLWVSHSTWSGPATGRPDHADPVPESLAWDLWLGVAPERPYVKEIYHPMKWRSWKDFGAGTLGDMGCHIFDPVFSALELRPPTSVISRGPQDYEETYAPDGDITYQFAGTKHTTDAITCRWTDGHDGSRPEVAKAQLPQDVSLPSSGSFMVGEQGVMLLPHYGPLPTFFSDGQPMDIAVESVGGVNHYHQWTDACRGEGQTSTPFSYSCPVTEAVLVGTVAGRFHDRPLHWDSQQLRFDDPAATELVHRIYRDGRQLQGLPGVVAS